MAKSKGIGCGGIFFAFLVVLFIGSLVNGTDEAELNVSQSGSGSAATSGETAKTFQNARCLEVSPTLVDSIGQGFDGSTLTGRAAGFIASQYADVKFVAVEFTPNGLSEPSIAVFGTNDDDLSDMKLDGLIIPVDGFAKEFSDWGDAAALGLSITDAGAKESIECLSLPGFKMADPPAVPEGFDQSDFLEVAESRYGVVDETYDDGSTLTVMQLAFRICDSDVATMKSNLGAKWDTSFNKYAIESLCPHKLN